MRESRFRSSRAFSTALGPASKRASCWLEAADAETPDSGSADGAAFGGGALPAIFGASCSESLSISARTWRARSRDVGGDAGQAGHVDAVGAIGAALDDLVQEDDLVAPLAHGDGQVEHAGQAFTQLGELVVVGGEQRARAGLTVEVLDDRPGQG